VPPPVWSPAPTPGAVREPQKRSDGITEDKTPRNAWLLPGYFFENVMVAGIRYRNVLQTSFTDNSKANPAFVRFEYNQHECLNTKGSRLEDGGIDVDNGFSECVEDPKPGSPNNLRIRISKTVRFTRPGRFVKEMNDLAHVLVPLTLDAWLHNLVFQP